MQFLRTRVFRAVAVGSVAILTATCSQPEPDEPPDVYLIVVDTLRADRLGCYGYPRPTSPFIDQLASEGAMFLDNSAQSSWTKPSMVSLMSGHYVTDYKDSLSEPFPSLAESFSASGYHCVGIVGNVLLSEKRGFDRGFDHYDAREVTGAENAERKARGMMATPCRSVDTMRVELERLLDEEFARRDAGQRRPVLAYLHPMEPHDPYEQHPDYADILANEDLPDVIPTPWHLATAAELERDVASEEVSDEWRTMNDHRARYDREVRYTDEQLRLFFERLEAQGRLDNALIAIVADHGEGLYDSLEMLRADKRLEAPLVRAFKQGHGRTHSRPLIQTPLILWGRGVPAGIVVEEAVENVDLYPTLIELSGLTPPDALHGRSLVPLMRGEAEEWKRDLHSYTLFATAIRERSTGLKLTLISPAGRKLDAVPQLYDTRADPEERVNLFDERPLDVERLTNKLHQWKQAFPMTSADPTTTVDPEHLRHMRALGYIGDD
jgi:arylsulfatase A-like enzyme